MAALTVEGQHVIGATDPFITIEGEGLVRVLTSTVGLVNTGIHVFGLPEIDTGGPPPTPTQAFYQPTFRGRRR